MTGPRPRDELGALLRELLDCPLCATTNAAWMMMNIAQGGESKPLRVVAFRARSIRLECRDCGLRFSVDPGNLADAYADRQMPSREKVEQDARQHASGNPAEYLPSLMKMQQLAEEFRHQQRERILGPHRRGVAAATPRKGQIRFPKR